MNISNQEFCLITYIDDEQDDTNNFDIIGYYNSKEEAEHIVDILKNNKNSKFIYMVCEVYDDQQKIEK